MTSVSEQPKSRRASTQNSGIHLVNRLGSKPIGFCTVTDALLYPPDQANSPYVSAPAILFLLFSFLLLSHTLNKPAVISEHQSLDAKPQHVMTMHNPYNSVSWETKQYMKRFCAVKILWYHF